MIKNLTLFVLLFTSVTKIACQADSLSPHSITVGWEGYVYTGGAYLGGASQFVIQYSYSFFNRDLEASIGISSMNHDSDRAVCFPVEMRLGNGAVKLGAGGIFVTDSDLFAPDRSVLIPSLSLLVRPRFRKKPTFFCLDLRLLFTRQYAGVYSWFNPPYERKGTSVSPGIGLALGFGVD